MKIIEGFAVRTANGCVRELWGKNKQNYQRKRNGARGAPIPQFRDITGAYKKTYPSVYQRRVKGLGHTF